MSDNEFRDLAAAEEMAAAFHAGEFTLGETVDADEVLPPRSEVPADSDDTLVVTTVRFTVRQKRKAEQIAEQRGVDVATLVRGWVDEGLAEVEEDYQVSAADLKRALAGLRRTA